MGESQHPDPGSGMNNPDHIFWSLETISFAFFGVKILKFFDEDPGSGMETVRIRDGKKSDPGSGINIPDPPHCEVPKKTIRFLFVKKYLLLTVLLYDVIYVAIAQLQSIPSRYRSGQALLQMSYCF
jgi:hypothetical protein